MKEYTFEQYLNTCNNPATIPFFAIICMLHTADRFDFRLKINNFTVNGYDEDVAYIFDIEYDMDNCEICALSVNGYNLEKDTDLFIYYADQIEKHAFEIEKINLEKKMIIVYDCGEFRIID